MREQGCTSQQRLQTSDKQGPLFKMVFFMPPKELWEAYSNRTLSPSVSPASCPVHISYIFWGRNSKFGVWMHLGMAECRIPFSGRSDLDLWLSFYSNHNVRPSVCLSVHPSSCPVHISYILWGRNSKFDVWMHLGMAECRASFWGHCDLELDLWPSFYKLHWVWCIFLYSLR